MVGAGVADVSVVARYAGYIAAAWVIVGWLTFGWMIRSGKVALAQAVPTFWETIRKWPVLWGAIVFALFLRFTMWLWKKQPPRASTFRQIVDQQLAPPPEAAAPAPPQAAEGPAPHGT